jgi:hypothetical protein
MFCHNHIPQTTERVNTSSEPSNINCCVQRSTEGKTPYQIPAITSERSPQFSDMNSV